MTGYTLRTVTSTGWKSPPRRIRIATPPSEIPPPVPSIDGYPQDGSVGDVLDWVDQADTANRAKAAIVAEHGRSKPRKTLLTQLNERTGT